MLTGDQQAAKHRQSQGCAAGRRYDSDHLAGTAPLIPLPVKPGEQAARRRGQANDQCAADDEVRPGALPGEIAGDPAGG